MTVALPELRVLRYFLTVVEHRSFTRAASALHVTQQSLSEAVGKLEAQLGCELLNRSPRGLQPTAAGTVLAREASDLLAAAERAVIRTQLTCGRLSGALRVACSFDLQADLQELLSPLIASHRDLALRFSVAPQRDLLHGLLDQTLDLALTWELADEDRDDDLTSSTVRRDPLGALMCADHPLAGETVTVGQLLGYELVMHERALAPGPYDAMLGPLVATGTPRITHVDIYASGHAARVRAVADTDRVALGTARAFGPLRSDLALVPLIPTIEIEIVWLHRQGATLPAAVAASASCS